MWRYCVSDWVSIALKASRLGYSLHGHDVKVTLCIESDRIVDVEEVARSLRSVLDRLDYRPLWESLGREDPLVEDLLVEIAGEAVKAGVRVSSVSAALPRGRIIEYKPPE